MPRSVGPTRRGRPHTNRRCAGLTEPAPAQRGRRNCREGECRRLKPAPAQRGKTVPPSQESATVPPARTQKGKTAGFFAWSVPAASRSLRLGEDGMCSTRNYCGMQLVPTPRRRRLGAGKVQTVSLGPGVQCARWPAKEHLGNYPRHSSGSRLPLWTATSTGIGGWTGGASRACSPTADSGLPWQGLDRAHLADIVGRRRPRGGGELVMPGGRPKSGAPARPASPATG